MKENIAKISGADFGYRTKAKSRILLKNINLEIRSGELVCIIGKNGSGKSTMLKTMTRLQPLLGGEILYTGRNIMDFGREEFAKFCGFVSTDRIQAEQMNIRELVELGRFPYTNWIGKLSSEDREEVDKAMHAVGISHMHEAGLSEISDGERQRAMIARTLAQNTDFILLDEPSAFLDIPNKYEITSLLKSLCSMGRTVLFSTHDLHLALQYADKIWLIDEEAIVQGAPEDLVINGTIEKLFNTFNVVFERDTGEFESLVSSRKKIYIVPSGMDKMILSWTRKALRRAQFQIIPADDGNSPRLEVIKKNNKTVWNIRKENENLVFQNLYEMNDYLSKLKSHELH